MAAFAQGQVEERLQEREVRGRKRKVAVDCWFTSTGRTMPRMMKFENEDGCLQMVNNIRIIRREQKYYAGIYCQRFDCKATVDGVEREFILMFRPREHLWELILPDGGAER
ncbi:MAG: hypothetical protein Q4E91_08480 [Lachnospiraceae bacterium]|nr:hypothetical protein [Lachnospiraceae bacterium]